MSSLDKLLISGIRSFHPDDKQKVTFFHPLTLIVGHNGAGKTSIIEALKYACTGDQPLNTKGGAFVCDPKLADRNEVKGQVKLKFTNVSGRKVVCTRSLMAMQTPNSNTLKSKTLESLLLIEDPETGHTFALSSTCAEINEEVPNHLGVSKPILENVIFCHQEESFWPLSEPKTLKTKFDEIFAATRYTKALETIRSIRKKTLVQMTANKVQLDNDKISKTRAQKMRRELAKLEAEADSARARIDELDSGEIEKVLLETQALGRKQGEIAQLRNRLDQFNLEREMVLKNTESLENNTTILIDSNEELERKLLEFSQTMAKQSGGQKMFESRKAEIAAQIVAYQKQLSEQFSLKGGFDSEKQAHLEKLQERQVIAAELIAKHQFAQFSSHDLQEYDIPRFIAKLNEEHSTKTSELRRQKAHSKEKENEIQAELQKFRSELSSLHENKRITQEQSNRILEKISNLNSSINAMTESSDELEHISESILRAESAVNRIRESMDEMSRESTVSDLNGNLTGLERQAQRIRDEMNVLGLQGDSRARLSLKTADKQRKADAYNKLIMMMKPECESLTKQAFRPDTLERDLDDLIRGQEGRIKTVKEKHREKSAEMSGIDAKLSLLRQSFTSKSQELDAKSDSVRALCGDMDFHTAKSQAETNYEQAQESAMSLKSAGSMYNKFVAKFKSSKCCPLCDRGFEAQQAEQKFLAHLDNIISRVPLAASNAQTEVSKWKARLDELRDLQSTWDDCERLGNVEIPEVRSKRDNLERERGAQYGVFEDLETELHTMDAELVHINSLKARAQEAHTLRQEIQQLDREIAGLKSDLDASGSTKTMEEAQHEYESIQNQCKLIRQKMDRANNEIRVKTEELSAKETAVRELLSHKQQIEFQVKEKQRLKQNIAELQQENQKLSRHCADIDSQIEMLPRQIETLQSSLTTFQSQSSRDEDAAQKNLQNLTSSVNRIKSVQDYIDRYLNDRKEVQLQQCIARINTLQSDTERLNAEAASLALKIEAASKENSQILLTQRNISDNLQLRKFKTERRHLDDQIHNITRQIEDADHKSLREQHQKLSQQYEELVTERAEAMGALRQLEESCKHLQRDLNSDYKDIDKRYTENKFKYLADEMAMEDLDKYAKALEHAIMKFHSKKMEEINKIIRELWTKTYKGSDIDTIEIRSDPESKANNRSFNYRVVMIRDDVELDMRGRCSAGQKVIASLIIRLALAETFCLQCGILALDEPTTNLDSENITGLAQALVDIIAVRQKQSNFQIIIITHDETFVQALGRNDHAESYFRVEKIEGFSRIKQYALQNDMEE